MQGGLFGGDAVSAGPPNIRPAPTGPASHRTQPGGARAPRPTRATDIFPAAITTGWG